VFGLKQLEILALGGNRVIDKTLDKVAESPNLKGIDVTHCDGVSSISLDKMRRKFPKLDILSPARSNCLPGAIEGYH